MNFLLRVWPPIWKDEERGGGGGGGGEGERKMGNRFEMSEGIVRFEGVTKG